MMYRLITDADNKVKLPQNPRCNANIFEILTFSWMINIFKKGRNRDLEENDLYEKLDDHQSSLLGDKLEKIWKLEVDSAYKEHRNPSLLKALFQMFGAKYLIHGLLQFLNDILHKIPQPLFVGGLLAYFTTDGHDKVDVGYAYFYACGLVTIMLLSIIFNHSNQMEVVHFGMKIRVACCSIIYRKALNLSHTAIGKTTIGHVINLLSNDVNQFDSKIIFLQYLWIGPLQTIVITYLMWREIGMASLIGVSTFLFFIPFHGWLGKKMFTLRLKTAIKTDERLRLMNEIISAIQLIKMYSWEKPFEKLIEIARKNEIRQVRGSSYIRAILLSFLITMTRLQLFVSFLSYILLGYNISVRKVFVITAYYNILTQPMSLYFNQGLSAVPEMLVSIKRVQNCLLLEEKGSLKIIHSTNSAEDGSYNELAHSNDSAATTNMKIEDNTERFEVEIMDATAKWTDDQNSNSLENINFNVKPGELVAVIGPVGAGKSSLLQLILRELPLSEGNLSVRGKISYASQEPWLFGGSIQQNILFDSPMDKDRYKKVIEVCALHSDFEQFPCGDKTYVGERGATLSGGQRARINLARAIYKQADVYLLDDPLSAVDMRVGKHLFEQCITEYLKNKTCILITHQVRYLTNVDQIVVMKDATILAKGSYRELQVSGIDFTKLQIGSSEEEQNKTVESDIESNKTNNKSLNVNPCLCIRGSNKSILTCVDESKVNGSVNDVDEEPNEQPEIRSSGNKSMSIYLSYFSASGNMYEVFLLFVMYLIAQIFISGGEYWITYWVYLEEHVFYHGADSINNSTLTDTHYNGTAVNNKTSVTLLWWTISRQTCVIVFAFFTCSMLLAILIRSAIVVSVCIKASMNLHNKMFYAIIKATMYFFNTNSSGRILNRFSKDMGAIDEMLIMTLMDCLQIVFILIGVIIIVGAVNIYLMIPTIIIGFIFYKLRVFYLSTSRSVKRLEGITRSPVFAHFNESLRGLTTIRAFEAKNIVSKEFDNHQDLHSSAWYMIISSSRAFGFLLDVTCLSYISILIFSFLIINNNVYGGNVGLVITQAMRLIGIVQWTMRQTADLENHMSSVERVLEYTNVPQESALESPSDKKPPQEWPQQGQIVFKNFYLRYSPGTPHVLKDLNIKIEPIEKIGIVGRTGAGKSSLIGALFRLALNEGSIYIDDMDINKLGLQDLRSKISIIPQEPVLFSGTMRKNLDPFDEYSDHALWNALNDVELKDIIEDLPGGLNTKITEGGFNFSVGQRQLVSLARSILRNNKILVLDEATANCDQQTDALIQNTIRNKFRMCTVLTIAHRLNTVMDSDKVLVMDAGVMVEFDHPHLLLKTKDGFLHKMVEQTSRTTADLLHSIALESYKTLQRTKESVIRLID